MRTATLACSSTKRRGDWFASLIPRRHKQTPKSFRCPALLSVWALALLYNSGLDAQPRVLASDVTNFVHPITVEMVAHGLEQARQQDASAVLIRLNTRGGMLESARQIVQKFVVSPVPVVTYVTPSTAKGGEKCGQESGHEVPEGESKEKGQLPVYQSDRGLREPQSERVGFGWRPTQLVQRSRACDWWPASTAGSRC